MRDSMYRSQRDAIARTVDFWRCKGWDLDVLTRAIQLVEDGATAWDAAEIALDEAEEHERFRDAFEASRNITGG